MTEERQMSNSKSKRSMHCMGPIYGFISNWSIPLPHTRVQFEIQDSGFDKVYYEVFYQIIFQPSSLSDSTKTWLKISQKATWEAFDLSLYSIALSHHRCSTLSRVDVDQRSDIFCWELSAHKFHKKRWMLPDYALQASTSHCIGSKWEAKLPKCDHGWKVETSRESKRRPSKNVRTQLRAYLESVSYGYLLSLLVLVTASWTLINLYLASGVSLNSFRLVRFEHCGSYPN